MATALEIVKQVADDLGELGEYVTTSVGTTTTLITSQLVNSNLESTELEDVAVLVESGNDAGQMRYVRRGGLDKSTGTITTADAFTNAIQTTVAFSLYGRIAPYRRLNSPGILECLSNGLRWLSVRDILSVAGVTGQKHYTLDTTTYPWLTEEWRIAAVEYPVTNSDDVPSVLSRALWEWVADAETRKLRFRSAPFQTGQTFKLRVYRPANSRLILNARLRSAITGGIVTSVAVEQGGYYSAVPTVTPASGAATFTAVLSGGTSGTLQSVTVTSGGIGYPTAPALTVTRDASDTGWRDQTTQTARLFDISDETIADVTDAAEAAKAEIYDAWADQRAPGAEVEEWRRKAQQARAGLKRRLFRQPPDPRTGIPNLRPTRVFGAMGPRVWWTS